MRLRHPGGELVHVGYCTNVHPAEDLDGILAQLDTYALPVRERLEEPVLGIGLWLAHPVAAALAAEAGLTRRLRAELTARGLEVVTLNGFPYEGFHRPVVKHAVYRPDWTSPDRRRYTANLARVLARLLPDDVAEGSISTLPFGWSADWRPHHSDMAARQIRLLGAELGEIGRRTGRTVRVAFEPEPGCLVETTTDAVRHLSDLDPHHFGLCLDICHLAVAFETPEEAVNRLAGAGIPVVKAQISCALHAEDPANAGTRAALAAFAEPRFLHQTRRAGRPATGTDDLPEAFTGPAALGDGSPWRTHFHIPVHADPVPPLTSTRSVLRGALAALLRADHPVTRHFETETYTWSVLPEPPLDSAGLADGIAAELAWTRRELLGLGLSAPNPEPERDRSPEWNRSAR
ncbi:metabolite traffic protein EboE [Streptomyces sp. NBC_00513]|uniref:metabolite traffic protein EboE n=1 Tax=unclassified Streptomyces TaxID=2593676 RepID=UPI00225571D8|nr:metabolite traffic protein EboE [Streptomyces sp. NBC_00424]MCX5070987.1 metabolite traffic protein EboE [Streptomyces sp. NBC_00424]WUD45578.1 metabolite traffic protein EboE [Streptomyces sp. NBC_00513]